MPGGLMSLIGFGPHDTYLKSNQQVNFFNNSNKNVDFFKASFQRFVNFSIEPMRGEKYIFKVMYRRDPEFVKAQFLGNVEFKIN